MEKRIIALILLVALLLTGCNNNGNNGDNVGNGGNADNNGNNTPGENEQGNNTTDNEASYGNSLDSLGAMDGYFDGKTNSVKVNCVSGTPGCYKIEGNVITFTSVKAESVYTISGEFSGSIVIDVGDAYKFNLELAGFSIVSDSESPITVLSGDEVSIKAKNNTKNYIYDTRSAIPENDTDSPSGAIHSDVDLEIGGKGNLYVVSNNNNGIHSKNDLQVKNLKLVVGCKDNALKGNDSVEFENVTATLIASAGDAIKTTRSDISSKGNQRGTVSFIGGKYQLYSACDGIDAAYNVIVRSGVSLDIFTGKYSAHTESVVADVSAKGIKAANEIVIAGNLNIKSFDNAIHANNDSVLENGNSPLGNVTINGGSISLYAHKEGLHADGSLAINGGKTVIISLDNGVSAINAKQGYTYTAGTLFAIMQDSKVADSATNCGNFATVGKRTSLSLEKGKYLVAVIGGDRLTVNLPVTITACIVMLGSNGATASSPVNSSIKLAEGDFIWE